MALSQARNPKRNAVCYPYLAQDVADEMLLAVVGGEDRDLLGRVATETHVLVHRHLMKDNITARRTRVRDR